MGPKNRANGARRETKNQIKAFLTAAERLLTHRGYAYANKAFRQAVLVKYEGSSLEAII